MAKRRRHGRVGEHIFQTVEQLTAGGKMSKLAAFRQVAKSSGKSLGTVSANYYRLARKKGVKLRTRRRLRPTPEVQKGARPQTASRLVATLGRLLRAQAREIAVLRKKTERFAAIRQLIVTDRAN